MAEVTITASRFNHHACKQCGKQAFAVQGESRVDPTCGCYAPMRICKYWVITTKILNHSYFNRGFMYGLGSATFNYS